VDGVSYGGLVKITSYWKRGAWGDIKLQRIIETLRKKDIAKEDLRELLRLGVLRIETTKHKGLNIKEALNE